MKKINLITSALFAVLFILIIPVFAKGAAMDNKVVYLTFDDGPSPNNTLRILDILNENGVKASFFVVGRNVTTYPNIVKKMDRDEMAIFPHCNNHIYKELYSSKEYYFKDLKSCESSIKEATGKNKDAVFIRMPGGSDNQVGSKEVLLAIKNEIRARGMNYIDWNIDSGDASAVRVSSDSIKKNINKFAGGYKVEVILMHDLDAKDTTAQVLKEVIEEYKVMGYKFKTLDKMEPWEIEYLKNIKVINR